MTVLAVVGGSGGVGASVLAAALCVRASRAQRSVVAVDGRRYGGGLDVTFGAEQEDGLRWTDLVRARGRVDGQALVDRLPMVDGVPVLSYDRGACDVPAETMAAVLAGLRDAAELVVVDLPRPGEDGFAVYAGALDAFVLVSGVQVRSLAASVAVLPAVRAHCGLGWVAARGTARGRFGEAVADALDLPLLVWLGEDRWLAGDLLHGIPPGRRRGPLADAADVLLASVLSSPVAVAS